MTSQPTAEAIKVGWTTEYSRPERIDDITGAPAEALFASGLSQWDIPAEAEVTAAINHALRVFGGARGCAGEVAAAFGERPETAVARMRWALRVVQLTYPQEVADEGIRRSWDSSISRH